MNHEIINVLKLILALLIVGIFAGKFLSAYNTSIHNQAIDGCSQNSGYQTSFINEQKQTITISEPQKNAYLKCLVDKGVTEQK